MLPAAHRLRRSADFRAVRRGRRAGTGLLSVQVTVPPSKPSTQPGRDGRDRVRAGFVVGRAVGPAVTRNRVRRRLRHLVAQRLDRLPAGTDLVVRALPGAAAASFTALGRDLDRCLARVTVAGP